MCFAVCGSVEPSVIYIITCKKLGLCSGGSMFDKQARVLGFVGKHIGQLDAGSGGLFSRSWRKFTWSGMVVLVFFLLSEARG